MLTQDSIEGSHRLNQSYGLERRGELDHQESSFVGPQSRSFVSSVPVNGVETAAVDDTDLVGMTVSVRIDLDVSPSGSRRFRIR